ncbi:hypothetical protein [Peribacillus aracenensis]|uniref:hypothetical protein n=1 Tax=Peribacillus aracenensis TaxID=2976708 RepID=UPI0021A9776A|nr:hypothetical protein [Peribacillus sp. BBB004]
MNTWEKMIIPGRSLKKYRPVVYLLVLIGIVWLFRRVIIQLLLTVCLISFIGFILYKAISYVLNFSFFILYLALCTIALVFAIGGGLWLLNLMGQ